MEQVTSHLLPILTCRLFFARIYGRNSRMLAQLQLKKSLVIMTIMSRFQLCRRKRLRKFSVLHLSPQKERSRVDVLWSGYSSLYCCVIIQPQLSVERLPPFAPCCLQTMAPRDFLLHQSVWRRPDAVTKLFKQYKNFPI